VLIISVWQCTMITVRYTHGRFGLLTVQNCIKGINTIKYRLLDLGFPFFAAINSSTDVSCEWIFIIIVLDDRSASRN
jgi:hypothetical protein